MSVNSDGSSQQQPIQFGKAQSCRYEDIIHHLRWSFFADEPLNKSMALSEPGESIPELEEFSRNVLSQNMSTVATVNNEVVGAILFGVPSKDYPQEFQNPKLEKIFKLIKEATESCDFSDVDEKHIVDLKILSVDDKMRGRGVATQLYRLGEQTCKDNGFKMMRADATALFSQKILEKYGWEAVKEVKYNEYPNPENPLFKVEPPHGSLRVMVKRI